MDYRNNKVDSQIKNNINNYTKVMAEGYCVKCKSKREMDGAKEVAMNGKGGKKRAALTGTCSKCGTKMFKIIGLKK